MYDNLNTFDCRPYCIVFSAVFIPLDRSKRLTLHSLLDMLILIRT